MNSKQQNFKRMAEARTNKIINMINLLGNLCNTSYYEYTNHQIEAIFDAIQSELDKTKEKFNKDKQKGKRKFEL